MDPSLLKDLQDFKKRSASQPTVEAKKAKPSSKKPSGSKSRAPPKHLPKELLQPKKASSPTLDKNHLKLRSNKRFVVIAKIVDFMKNRHLTRQFEPLSLDEILDKINYTDINPNDKSWLENNALKENPKLAFKDGKFAFSPKYHIRDKKQLVKLLEKHEERGHGGILLDDVRESLPDADKIVRNVSSRIMFITRSCDKKVLLFYNNKGYKMEIDEEFQKHWRAVSVDGIGEADIEKYLVKAGISTMQDTGVKRTQQMPQRKKAKRKKQFKKLNVHLDESTLRDYGQDNH
ncbi:predicted protein [Nematostella vectensis]|uniref:Transcription initiation factor IIE subunit beta n=1 Tax=Nematostella vectensis TaxID=45351 RepID=A7SZU7_NEMVE|nr:transcription initiation factor IIE subunit beta [Nematostella vectensis]EDO30771.1 predicted protein [Nematostella vectensis]|eukprot:XP_001622871.1 predicted protein [Nematostella vectensis]